MSVIIRFSPVKISLHQKHGSVGRSRIISVGSQIVTLQRERQLLVGNRLRMSLSAGHRINSCFLVRICLPPTAHPVHSHTRGIRQQFTHRGHSVFAGLRINIIQIGLIDRLTVLVISGIDDAHRVVFAAITLCSFVGDLFGVLAQFSFECVDRIRYRCHTPIHVLVFAGVAGVQLHMPFRYYQIESARTVNNSIVRIVVCQFGFVPNRQVFGFPTLAGFRSSSEQARISRRKSIQIERIQLADKLIRIRNRVQQIQRNAIRRFAA